MKPTAAALRAAKKFHALEDLPGPYYGLEGIAKIIDEKTQLPGIIKAAEELLNYVGGHDEKKWDHPINVMRRAIEQAKGRIP